MDDTFKTLIKVMIVCFFARNVEYTHTFLFPMYNKL